MKRLPVYLCCCILPALVSIHSCRKPLEYYSAADFEKAQKIDAHFHYLTTDDSYMKFADSMNFKLLTPNWDGDISIDEQLGISHGIWKENKEDYAFFGTFSAEGFEEADFADHTISRIDDCLEKGAAGIKIWKNIGMVLQDSAGRYIMIDDPAFEPVFTYLEKNHIPVIAHLGEPRDCWLPEEEMTDPSDVFYYRNNPQYYMHLHPEVPSYEEQIDARDHVLRKYPDLDFVGAHLGSLEWSIDELAERLDTYPNFRVDLAARMFHLQYQSENDREKVRDFMIKYQDRILYGTDFEVHDNPGINTQTIRDNLWNGWYRQWLYLATDSTLNVKGLKLPRKVVDKIYYKNAARFFN